MLLAVVTISAFSPITQSINQSLSQSFPIKHSFTPSLPCISSLRRHKTLCSSCCGAISVSLPFHHTTTTTSLNYRSFPLTPPSPPAAYYPSCYGAISVFFFNHSLTIHHNIYNPSFLPVSFHTPQLLLHLLSYQSLFRPIPVILLIIPSNSSISQSTLVSNTKVKDS